MELESITLEHQKLEFLIEIKEPFEIPMMASLTIKKETMTGIIKLGAIGTYGATASKVSLC